MQPGFEVVKTLNAYLSYSICVTFLVYHISNQTLYSEVPSWVLWPKEVVEQPVERLYTIDHYGPRLPIITSASN